MLQRQQRIRKRPTPTHHCHAGRLHDHEHRYDWHQMTTHSEVGMTTMETTMVMDTTENEGMNQTVEKVAANEDMVESAQ